MWMEPKKQSSKKAPSHEQTALLFTRIPWMMFAKGCLMYALTLYTLFLFQLYERVTFSSLQRFPPELPPKPLLTIALSLSQKCALCHKNKIFFHINLPKKEQKQQHDFRRRGRKLQKRISRTKKKTNQTGFSKHSSL